jgi:hypothetical protein
MSIARTKAATVFRSEQPPDGGLFYRASDLVRALLEARDARVLSPLQDRLRRATLLLLDELGVVPFEKAGGELLFDVLSARHERAATIITSNLAFSEWQPRLRRRQADRGSPRPCRPARRWPRHPRARRSRRRHGQTQRADRGDGADLPMKYPPPLVGGWVTF